MKRCFCLLGVFVFLLPSLALAVTVHPENIKLIKLGLMENVPKYCPEIPRITATAAKYFFDNNKATLVLISHSNHHRIYGGLHLTEDLPPKIEPNQLLRQKDHILIAY